MTLGEKIRSLRKDRGMTQTDLAKKLNTTKQTIGKYEQGIVTNLPLYRIQEIADIFDVSPGYLTGWETDAFDGLSAERYLIPEEIRKTNFNYFMEKNGLTLDIVAAKLNVGVQSLVRLIDGDDDAIPRVKKVELPYILGCKYEEIFPDPHSEFRSARRPVKSMTELSDCEKALVEAWRAADEKARRKVSIDLEDYGFSYNPKNE